MCKLGSSLCVCVSHILMEEGRKREKNKWPRFGWFSLVESDHGGSPLSI